MLMLRDLRDGKPVKARASRSWRNGFSAMTLGIAALNGPDCSFSTGHHQKGIRDGSLFINCGIAEKAKFISAPETELFEKLGQPSWDVVGEGVGGLVHLVKGCV